MVECPRDLELIMRFRKLYFTWISLALHKLN